MKRALPVWRSLLYVPTNVEKFVDKAHTRGADAIQLDLEDSVPPAEKAAARKLVAQAAARVRRGGADVVVRINRPLALAVRDVEHAVSRDVDALAITKVDGPSHLRLVDELIGDCEEKAGLPHGHTKLIAMIETPASFFEMPAIANASERVVAMNIGGEDFALECAMEPSDEALLMPKQQMIIAARAAGVLPLGYIGTVADFSDWDKFRAMVRRSRQFGFEGASCIHPGQVPIVNECYSPSREDVAYAERIVEGDRTARAEGRGSWQLDGKMIDIPVVERANRVLARARAIAARTARAKAAGG